MQGDLDLRDDPERPLAADDQRRQVIAAVVLARAVDRAHDPTVGEHSRQPANLLAHHAVGADTQPAGVGGDHPSDGGGVPGGEIDTEVQVRGPGKRGKGGGRDTRADHHRPLQMVHRLHPVQPSGEQEKGRPIRNRATDESRVPTLDLHGDPRRPRRHEDGGDLLGRVRPDRPDGRAAPAPCPVDAVPREDVRVGRQGDPVRRQGLDQRGRQANVGLPPVDRTGAGPTGPLRRMVRRAHGEILPTPRGGPSGTASSVMTQAYEWSPSQRRPWQSLASGRSGVATTPSGVRCTPAGPRGSTRAGPRRTRPEGLPAGSAPPRVGCAVLSGWQACTAGLVVLSNEEEPFNAHRVT